jgi:hypothetical protein
MAIAPTAVAPAFWPRAIAEAPVAVLPLPIAKAPAPFAVLFAPMPTAPVPVTTLIQISGHHELTLNARRAITVLWHNAHMQGVEAGKDYTIEIDNLKADRHKGYERLEEAITALMRAILTVKMPGGKTTRVQFLGGNDLDPDRPAGVLTYSFDKRLIEILKTSTTWGKITLPVLMPSRQNTRSASTRTCHR